jgi:FeS assembly protein IscX
MMSSVEMRRILAEWRLRLQRVKDIVQPPSWTEKEWRQFSQALALLVREHGRSWIVDPNVYWDLRWKLQEGGELIAQVEHVPGEKTSLVVAQNGGFAEQVGSYTWLWAEFNMEGNFARDPYWVEGTWKDALTAFLIPLDRQSSYLLAGRAETPAALLLQEGARPNDGVALLPGINENGHVSNGEYTNGQNGKHDSPNQAMPEPPAERQADPVHETTIARDTAPAAEKTAEPVSPRIDTPATFAIRWGMPQKLTWKDTDEIAYSLIDTFPDQDPLKLSFPKLHKMITELEDFGDDPTKSSESILETIQMAWYEEVK